MESNEIEKFVRNTLDEIGFHDEPNFEEIRAMTKHIDENNDGKISKEELFNFMKKLAGL